MAIDIRDLPGTSALVRDYHHDFSRLTRYYTWNPHDPGALRAQAARCAAHDYPRQAVVDVLRRRHLAWGAPAALLTQIDRLADARTLAVVTGQQTTLFGGPLYSLYKALTAVAVAAQWERLLDRPVVPLFWMASEDHDLAEADHVDLADHDGIPRRIRHAAWPEPGGVMPATLYLGPAIHETLERAWEFLPASEFSQDVRAALTAAYAPDSTLAEAFAYWMLWLLGDTGLILVDGADPALKPLAARVFLQEIDQAPRAAEAILAVSQALRADGYPAQIDARPDGVNCFLLRQGRRALARDPQGFFLRDTGERIAPADLKAVASAEPQTLSPNVALRPIVQDSLFPTLAYVAGPGELSYFAQLRPVYDQHGIPMPIILPRASFTLLEPRTARLLERFQLQLRDLAPEPEQLTSRLLRAQLPADFEETLAAARQGLDALLHPLHEVIVRVDPTLQAAVGQTTGHIKGHLEQLERKVVQALKRREADTRQQILRLREGLMPGGRPQERVFPLLPYLVKFGPAALARIRKATQGPGWTHDLLRLGTEGERTGAVP